MGYRAMTDDASQALLDELDVPPKAWRLIDEATWYAALETCELLHQWGSALLVDDGECLWVFVRDVTPDKRHTVVRHGAALTEVGRHGVRHVELLARRAATVIAEAQRRGSSTVSEMSVESAASRAFVGAAEELYETLTELPPVAR